MGDRERKKRKRDGAAGKGAAREPDAKKPAASFDPEAFKGKLMEIFARNELPNETRYARIITLCVQTIIEHAPTKAGKARKPVSASELADEILVRIFSRALSVPCADVRWVAGWRRRHNQALVRRRSVIDARPTSR
jgi:hypothetical protein